MRKLITFLIIALFALPFLTYSQSSNDDDFFSYCHILEMAKRNGYRLVPLSTYFEGELKPKEIIMRHDVDHSPDIALEMAEQEYRYGFKCSYFFRWSTVDSKVIKMIKELGHEVGLHYETIATYCRERNIEDATLITKEMMQEMQNILKEEIRKFEKLYGDVQTIVTHGDSWNRKLGIPNSKLLEGMPLDFYGIIGRAQPLDLDELTIYFSDSGGNWAYSPKPFIRKGKTFMYILTHPSWWAERVI